MAGPSTSSSSLYTETQELNQRLVRIANQNTILSDLDIITSGASTQGQVLLDTEAVNHFLNESPHAPDVTDKDAIFTTKLNEQVATVILCQPKNTALAYLTVISRGTVVINEIKMKIVKIVKGRSIIARQSQHAEGDPIMIAAALLLYATRRGISNLFKLVKSPILEHIGLHQDQAAKVMIRLAVKNRNKDDIFPATIELITTIFPNIKLEYNGERAQSWPQEQEIQPLRLSRQEPPSQSNQADGDHAALTRVERWGGIFVNMLDIAKQNLGVSQEINNAMEVRANMRQEIDAVKEMLQFSQLEQHATRVRLEEVEARNEELQQVIKRRCNQQTTTLITNLCADRLKLPVNICQEYTATLLTRLRLELESIYIEVSCPIQGFAEKAMLLYKLGLSKILLTGGAANYLQENLPLTVTIDQAYDQISFLIRSGKGHVLE